MITDYKRLKKLRRYGSRRVKVFCKRAAKCGWSATGIICAVRFGFETFKPR